MPYFFSFTYNKSVRGYRRARDRFYLASCQKWGTVLCVSKHWWVSFCHKNHLCSHSHHRSEEVSQSWKGNRKDRFFLSKETSAQKAEVTSFHPHVTGLAFDPSASKMTGSRSKRHTTTNKKTTWIQIRWGKKPEYMHCFFNTNTQKGNDVVGKCGPLFYRRLISSPRRWPPHHPSLFSLQLLTQPTPQRLTSGFLLLSSHSFYYLSPLTPDFLYPIFSSVPIGLTTSSINSGIIISCQNPNVCFMRIIEGGQSSKEDGVWGNENENENDHHTKGQKRVGEL